MDKDKLILADGSEIELESSQGMEVLRVCTQSHGMACVLWDRLTRENLKEVCIREGDGAITGRYRDLSLDHISGKDNTDGSVQLTISLLKKTYVEMLEERVAELAAGSRTHDEAITDLGQVVSDIAEGER